MDLQRISNRAFFLFILSKRSFPPNQNVIICQSVVYLCMSFSLLFDLIRLIAFSFIHLNYGF
ncbi:uncharacterized protein RHIMIDRAFT_41419 [Rhizopus microsporus ATCC 52813]|uniref:Uncharacterized protein n=1 Tax=Rhizopus microsporus ATCC 52813 TaxID=1340429 RepID=A0A2G4SMJ1_RHIZD|nr:uncharacterized protein RHIMIDRAFT_41419 [Rhizopus microsporus ATCC 52813]PHZ09984.1 hypothetical protein RHIMIDRAFT_41419 [Rhizopus microsporus ATCC 52813]